MTLNIFASGNFDGHGGGEIIRQDSATGSLTLQTNSHLPTYERIGGLGSEWNLEGVGDYKGNGRDQILIENTAGALYLGEVCNDGKLHYTSLGGIGHEWSIIGTADYLHNGHSEFLMVNNSGPLSGHYYVGSYDASAPYHVDYHFFA